ncbi:unnamed protein product [Rotaria sp. Silwood2]|nr:unnamed protein product [Rotaria sp. Silwood2]
MENPKMQSARLQSYIRITEAVHKYIRYPFNPTQAGESASQNETHEQRISHTTIEERNRRCNFSVIQQLPTIHTIVPMPSVIREPAKHLIELLRNKWELPPPELIISVTGGAKIFNLPQRSRIALQKGLVSAAVTTDAWVFTGGTYAGVMKDVGDAFEKWTYKTSSVDRGHVQVPVIGIASWYYATNHRQLIQRRRVKLSSVGSAMPTATFSTVADREKLYLNCVPQEKPASYPLDPNHTHFILLDDKCGPNDETWRRYGFPVRADLTIQLRAEIEQEARCSSHYRHSNIDIYGTIENFPGHITKPNGFVVFNGDDVIRQNGYIKQVSIHFSNSHSPSVATDTSNHVVLYIISPTSETDCFQVVDALETDVQDYQYDKNKLTIHMYKYAVYVEQGQYLAIGFDKNSRSPSSLGDLSSCYTLDIDAVNRVYMNETSIKFQWSHERVAISFQIILTSGRIILFHNE